MPAVSGVLFDWREMRLVMVAVCGHLLTELSVIVHRRLGASSCEAEHTER